MSLVGTAQIANQFRELMISTKFAVEDRLVVRSWSELSEGSTIILKERSIALLRSAVETLTGRKEKVNLFYIPDRRNVDERCELHTDNGLVQYLALRNRPKIMYQYEHDEGNLCVTPEVTPEPPVFSGTSASNENDFDDLETNSRAPSVSTVTSFVIFQVN